MNTCSWTGFTPSSALVQATCRMECAFSAAEHLVADLQADDHRDIPLIPEGHRREIHARILRFRDEAKYQAEIVRRETQRDETLPAQLVTG